MIGGPYEVPKDAPMRRMNVGGRMCDLLVIPKSEPAQFVLVMGPLWTRFELRYPDGAGPYTPPQSRTLEVIRGNPQADGVP